MDCVDRGRGRHRGGGPGAATPAPMPALRAWPYPALVKGDHPRASDVRIKHDRLVILAHHQVGLSHRAPSSVSRASFVHHAMTCTGVACHPPNSCPRNTSDAGHRARGGGRDQGTSEVLRPARPFTTERIAGLPHGPTHGGATSCSGVRVVPFRGHERAAPSPSRRCAGPRLRGAHRGRLRTLRRRSARSPEGPGTAGHRGFLRQQ
jgi:hypothetical protein